MHVIYRVVKLLLPFVDIEEVALGIENVPLRPAISRMLLALLEVPRAKDINIPADFHSLCQLWVSSCHDCSLELLVQALLCTPGFGYLVTGIASICEFSHTQS